MQCNSNLIVTNNKSSKLENKTNLYSGKQLKDPHSQKNRNETKTKIPFKASDVIWYGKLKSFPSSGLYFNTEINPLSSPTYLHISAKIFVEIST